MTLDLSAVTDSLIGLISKQWSSAPIWTELGSAQPPPNITGLAPDAARLQSGPQLSMYLYHVESDNAQESLFWQPQMLGAAGGEPTRFLPLALDLFYLLFAYSEASYIDEQQAMSVAVRIFHANPVVRSDAGAAVPWELTLTMEHRSYDELSRLWQATTAPLRMSVVYRAAVVFIDPDQMPQAGPSTTAFSLVADPVALPVPADYPVLFGVFRDGAYLGPTGVSVPFPQSPATVAPGQTAWLLGSDLGSAGVSDSVYLLPPGGGPETNVTAWAVAAESNAAKFVLTLPTTGGQAPAAVPVPGVYQLRVGSGTLGTSGATRSGSIPVSIAAYVDPSAGPMLSGSAPFTVNGTGFAPGETEVLVGTTALAEVASPPAAGEVRVDPAGTSLTFSPPPGAAGTVLAVRVRVNGVESDPALWVTL